MLRWPLQWKLEQDHVASFSFLWFLSLAMLFTKWCGCNMKMQCCYAKGMIVALIYRTQPEVVAILVMGTEIREIALEENDELSCEVDVNLRILLQGQTGLLIRVCLKLTDSHLTSKFIINYTPEEHSLSHAPILYYMPILFHHKSNYVLLRLKLVPPHTLSS